MKLHPGYERDIFRILTSEDIADVIPLLFAFFSSSFLYFLLVEKKISRVSAATTREIFFPREDKLHMFAPPCNILYILPLHVTSSIDH